jgi:hypothetical protein
MPICSCQVFIFRGDVSPYCTVIAMFLCYRVYLYLPTSSVLSVIFTSLEGGQLWLYDGAGMYHNDAIARRDYVFDGT